MEYKKVSDIRELFLNFFQEKGHTLVPSSSLVPSGDPTLLFTTAGMVQFKPYFTGITNPPYKKATSAQKCLRTTDLENVGKTERHCTFFEMLGNFSFGDYFKKEAIEYALEFTLNHLKIPQDKIWITIYENDEEAKELWIQAGIPQERIVRLGKKDNFWGPAGESGACGPCSELYMDRGASKGFPGCGTKSTCKPGCECDRFMEFWNLVFIQFNQTPEGELIPLQQKGIDTGAGVERVALLLQEVDSVYDTDEFLEIIHAIERLTKIPYSDSTKVSFRVISDHIRSVFFAIGDSIHPDRTGRGYVIRRLIRRASLFARKLGVKETFLYKLIPVLVEIYGNRYPELQEKRDEIQNILHQEEELFLNTLEQGLDELDKIIQKMEEQNRKILTGTESFRLYSTYGFPKEMTKELIEERGFIFDEDGFQAELEKDRNLSRETWKGKGSIYTSHIPPVELKPTEFVGYEKFSSTAKLLFLFHKDGKPDVILKEGEEGVIVLNQTVFYAESGGQIADQGYIQNENYIFKVEDVQKENDIFLHYGKVLKGEVKKGSIAHIEINVERRKNLANHHSATHLLHSALRAVLGDHVKQKASLVSDSYLRFDFSHPKPLTEEEITRVEEFVNDAIKNQYSVETKIMSLAEAKKTGALAFFDEKYGDKVRIVSMGDKSLEFCGGTHVPNTGDIEFFTIVKESSPGAGNRRIEAVSGKEVIHYFSKLIEELEEKIKGYNQTAQEVYSNNPKEKIQVSLPNAIQIQERFKEKGFQAIQELKKELSNLQALLKEKNQKIHKEKKKLEEKDILSNPNLIQELMQNKIESNGICIITKVFEGIDAKLLKELGDLLKSRMENVIALLGSKEKDSATLVYMCHPAIVKQGIHCGELLKHSMEILGGKGGGRPDMAQGGGKFPDKIELAIEKAIQIIKNKDNTNNEDPTQSSKERITA